MGETSAVEGILAHVNEDLSESIKSYATNTVLRRSRYLIVHREKGLLWGFCTHCREERVYDQPQKHNGDVTCSSCQSICIVKQRGRGRKYLLDSGYFVYFSKSLVDPNTITARGIFVQRDYSEDYTKVETVYKVTALYVFGNGKSQMMNRAYWWSGATWDVRKSIIAESNSIMASKSCYLSEESVAEAVAGTPFQYSTWEVHTRWTNRLLFFDVATKYPCVEYLTKIGLPEFVRTKVQGGRTFGAINWRGKTLDSVLKVSKQDLKAIRDADFPVSMFTLRLFQMSKKDGSNLSLKKAYMLGNLAGGSGQFGVLQKNNRYAKLNEIYNYVEKQFLRKNRGKLYSGGGQVLNTWRDYLFECKQLGMDMVDDSVLFPTNLHEAHQRTTARMKLKADKELSEKIRLRKLALKKLEFESGDLRIRPADDSEELIREGNALKHCVGSYAARYAEGRTDIFVIRKKDEPDVPFFTVEIQGGRISQVRGLRNCSPSPEVKSFIDAFEAAKLKKPERKGVAV